MWSNSPTKVLRPSEREKFDFARCRLTHRQVSSTGEHSENKNSQNFAGDIAVQLGHRGSSVMREGAAASDSVPGTGPAAVGNADDDASGGVVTSSFAVAGLSAIARHGGQVAAD